MEKARHVVQIREMLIPIGFRFRPTDEEVVVHYLKRKALSLPLPASVIPELDVYQTNPWDLPGDLKEKRYFFTRKKGNANKSSSSFCAGSGYWRPTGRAKRVLATGNNQTVGMKRSLVFYKGKRPHDSRTHWVMHQFYLVGCETSTTSNSTQRFMMQIEDWVVCCIHEKEVKNYGMVKSHQQSRKNRTWNEVIKQSSVEVMKMEASTELGPPPEHSSSLPSSSCSSGITEVSDQCNQEAHSAYELLSFLCTGKQ